VAAYLYGKDGGCMVPGFTVRQIADTNGAGDSFWGGFLYKVSTAEKHLDELTQEDLKEFARFGNAVASLCVEKKGAIPAMPELAQVERRIAK
jgi:fructokinase